MGLAIAAALVMVVIVAALTLLASGCAEVPNAKKLCVAADVAGRTLTASGVALRAVHNIDVEAHWQSECGGIVDHNEKIICRHRVVDDLADQYRARYRAAEEAVAAQHVLAEAIIESGLCRDEAKEGSQP